MRLSDLLFVSDQKRPSVQLRSSRGMIHNLKFLALVPIISACHTASHVAQQILRRSFDPNSTDETISSNLLDNTFKNNSLHIHQVLITFFQPFHKQFLTNNLSDFSS